MLQNPGIIRNRLKVAAAVTNAQKFLEVQDEFGSFDTFIWQFVDGKPKQNAWRSIAEDPGQHAGIGRDEQGTETARIQIRRQHHLLRPHAGNRHGERPHDRLLQIQRAIEMTLKFTKMHGAGNDFVVLDGVRQSIALSPEQIRFIADRHFGIGCDQILLVEKSQRDDADFRYRIFNADGGEVEQCGNGARCFVRFVHDNKLTSKREIVVETKSGLISPRLEDDGRVTVNMGAPIFEPSQIPFVSDSHEVIQPLEVGNEDRADYRRVHGQSACRTGG